MKQRIGYFVPEFPGQTHIFFWREIQVLEQMDWDVHILSTRLPASATISHTWASTAQQRTTYLVPWHLQHVLDLLQELRRSGRKGLLACLRLIRQAPDLSWSGKLRLLALLPIAAHLSHLSRQQQWQHVHVHSCANAANIALLAHHLSGLRYSLTLHGPSLNVYGANQAQKWRSAEFAIVVSHKLMQEVQTQLAKPLPPLTFAPMGVNVERIQRQRPYMPWQPGQVCRIFACGRLNPVKGHDLLIQAIEPLQQAGITVALRIAGEDEQGGTGYRQELEHLISRKGLEQSVQLLGAISEEQVRQELEMAHVFALSSLNEGIPVAVMEAMAMQVPVVTTNVGGNAELVCHGINGLLVEPGEPQWLTQAIEQILQDASLAQALSQQSRQTIETQFHHRRSAETLVDCLLHSQPHSQPTLSKRTLEATIGARSV